MSKVVIGIDQSYTRTGITVLCDKELFEMYSLDFEKIKTNTGKREFLSYQLYDIMCGVCREVVPDEMMIITERIRLRSQQFLSEAYIKATGALVATIIDCADKFKAINVPVYSVDTRSWKSQIVGNSKPLNNKYGINPEKYRTILYLRDKGLLRYIAEEYKGKGKKGVINVKIEGQKVPCKINDDLADSYCIAMYGFLPKSKQKLKEEMF